MPCSDGRESSSYHQISDMRRKIDKYARMLCNAMTAIEDERFVERRLSKELRSWWEDHKEVDRERKRRKARESRKEKQVAAALGKVNDADRELLGLPKRPGAVRKKIRRKKK